MKTATVRDLRTKFPVLADGQQIDITRRGRVIARLSPPGNGAAAPFKKPDMMKRLREIYGDYLMPEEEVKAIFDHNRGPS
jgi:antitoxin (DNA-binding transcriptional repressor) of toxin-antitoxin stability system